MGRRRLPAWRNSGLRPPGPVVDATKDYREEQDAVRRFIDDCCESLRDAFAPAAALLTAYLKWREGEGEKPVSTKVFWQELTARGYPSDTVCINDTPRKIRRHIRLVSEAD